MAGTLSLRRVRSCYQVTISHGSGGVADRPPG
jgi:hypothetical protein